MPSSRFGEASREPCSLFLICNHLFCALNIPLLSGADRVTNVGLRGGTKVNQKSKSAPPVVGVILLIGLGISCGGNQEAQQSTSEEGRRRGTAFDNPATNLQILEVEKPEDLRPIMRAFNAGLGVECRFCHEPPDFAKDTEQKERSRNMIVMVRYLNSEVFTWPNAPRATCFMCHRGHEEPELEPPPEESADTDTRRQAG